MSYRNNRNADSAPRPSVWPGILIGVTVGLAIAGWVAWYIQKSPNSFNNTVKPQPEKVVAAPALPHTSASAVSEAKPRFEFYKVLTDNAPPPSARQTQKHTEKPAATLKKEIYYLQVGSFSNADDADKLKAKLAMLGVEAGVQVATIPDKGVWHRVRLGPYQDSGEMTKARDTLKQNGMEATPMRAQ